MLFYVIPVLVLAALVVIFVAVKILREYERAVVFTLGRFQGVRGPGLVLLIPFFQEMVRVDLRIQVIEIPSQVERPDLATNAPESSDDQGHIVFLHSANVRLPDAQPHVRAVDKRAGSASIFEPSADVRGFKRTRAFVLLARLLPTMMHEVGGGAVTSYPAKLP